MTRCSPNSSVVPCCQNGAPIDDNIRHALWMNSTELQNIRLNITNVDRISVAIMTNHGWERVRVNSLT